MEDAATAEICRSQIWQWVHNEGTKLDDGRSLTPELVNDMIPTVLADIKQKVGSQPLHNGQYALAGELFQPILHDDAFTEFMTLPAYEFLN
jgi:malate synthase